MTDATSERTEDVAEAVAAYKRILSDVLESRPSGMRLRLARAMGKNRSFISQISKPSYPVPIPVQHLHTIIEVCRFSPAERAAFLKAYTRAHPRRIGRLAEVPRDRSLVLHLPDLGSARRNAQLDALLQEFAKRLVAVLRDDK